MANPQSYSNHQLNKSSSKAAYLFPKQKRFAHRTKFISESFYDLPSTGMKRTTSFGYGNKTSIIKKSQSPPPGTYQSITQFKDSKRGLTIAKGRNNVTFGDFLEGAKIRKDLPAPNRYTVALPPTKVGGMIFNKLPGQLDKAQKRLGPGPGTYNLKACEMISSGSYILSNMKNNISPRFYTQSSVSMQKMRLKHKLSASVHYQTLEKERGKYLLSKHKNIAVRTFSKSVRPGMEDKSKKNVPGFRYKSFSEFGNFS